MAEAVKRIITYHTRKLLLVVSSELIVLASRPWDRSCVLSSYFVLFYLLAYYYFTSFKISAVLSDCSDSAIVTAVSLRLSYSVPNHCRLQLEGMSVVASAFSADYVAPFGRPVPPKVISTLYFSATLVSYRWA